MTDLVQQEKIDRWAFHHCERENAKWTDAPDICPMRGKCPHCQNLAREAIEGTSMSKDDNKEPPAILVVTPKQNPELLSLHVGGISPVVPLVENEKVSFFSDPADKDWLIKQLDSWPRRVDSEKTINISYLMGTAAAVIKNLLGYREDNPLPPGSYRTPIETKAEAWDTLDRTIKNMGWKGITEVLDHIPTKDQVDQRSEQGRR